MGGNCCKSYDSDDDDDYAFDDPLAGIDGKPLLQNDPNPGSIPAYRARGSRFYF